jgi:GNAT superfamily N-acetyltransferase
MWRWRPGCPVRTASSPTHATCATRGAAGDGAEFALTVADDWQGLGLGRQLLVRLARHAQSQGLQQLHGSVLWDNRPMTGLVERLGGSLHTQHDDPGVLQARFRTAALAA